MGHSLNGWLQLKLPINSIPLKKRDGYKYLFQRYTVPFKKLDHCKWPTELIPLKFMAASAPLK